MGRPYLEELDRLAQTSSEAFELKIDVLKRALENASGHGLVIVASGGSLTVAKFLADCHQRAVGRPCRVVSPLVFQSDPSFARGHVWLLSAAGRNHDILAAAEHALESHAESVTAIIAATGSPLERRLSTYGSSRCVTFSLSVGADGFLATNSLWATCLLVERAVAAAFAMPSVDRREASIILNWARDAASRLPVRPGTLVGIADPLTLVGATDLEMRATEAALKNIWVTDLRNLAHGRHFWFAAQRENAVALILATTEYRELANRTANLLSAASPVHVVDVPGPSPSLASIAFSMFAAAELGANIGRDPGRPGVPEFGEALYNLEVPRKPRIVRSTVDDIINAKLGRYDSQLSELTREAWAPRLQGFVQALSKAEIAAVVFDFDGTLIESSRRYEPLEPRIADSLRRLLEGGLVIGIATGRGDSCGTSLRAALPEHLWSGVTVGYYNGSIIQSLTQTTLPEVQIDPVIAQAIEQLQEHLQNRRFRLRKYPKQCSVTLLDGTSLAETWCLVAAVLNELVGAEALRVWISSHSIDIVAALVTKVDVVRAVAARANCLPEQVLCFGDRARWPGNDFELLKSPLSLSSDECSLLPDRCWNLAGGEQQVAATCRQLGMFEVIGKRLFFQGLSS